VKGLYWITKSGDVVKATGPETPSGTVPCVRVSSGAFLGTRKLSKLRPATAHEVSMAISGRGR